jgi:hypothetical protein
LNVQGIKDFKQIEMHTAEQLAPEPSCFEVESGIERVKIYKSPDIDQILAELFKTRVNTLHSEIHKLINLICNKEELPQQWKESIIVHIYKKEW